MGGPFQMMSFTSSSIPEALGFTATSNNAARQEEKKKAIEKTKALQQKFAGLQKEWLTKYGYKKFVGDWFYADQLSTDNPRSHRAASTCRRAAFTPTASTARART